MLRGIQQLVNADAYPGLNALSDGINTALDGVEIVEQVGRLAKQVAPGLGQFNAASTAGKQHHVETHFHALNGVTNCRCG